ncbi:MAG TPA: cyclic nucleotide-binding domain-containing protein, partial [Ktedonobacteraceae bacterium]|nr:cyclic nucleotide-binding domain-containing protein [Ktedonobacteraceae bacterium]
PHPKILVTLAEIQLNTSDQDGVITIGRQPGVSLSLAHSSVSRLHAEVTCSGTEILLRDKGSSNGTFVNGHQLAQHTPYALRHHDRVRFGDVQFRFELRHRVSHSAQPRAGRFPHMQGTELHANSSRAIPDSVLKDKTTITKAIGRRAVESVGTHDVLPPPGEGVVAGLSHRKTVRELDEERIQFEINMCIGCDRCMDACPVPMSSLVTIADLNAATVTTRVAGQVEQFTHECIMCGSCVPVCPVDNHRDLLMLSLKQRLGTTWDVSPDVNRVNNQLPRGWTLSLLMSRLREQSILNNPQQVPDNYLLHLVRASQLRLLTPGEVVIREGEYGRDLYLILEGRLELTASTIDDTELVVAIIRRGEYVGEEGMLTGLPYRASARAQQPTLVLAIPEQAMQRLMELVPAVHHHFERYGNTRSLGSILKRMALFQGVSDADLQFLIQQTPIKQYGRNERLFAEDAKGGRPARETMHLLLEGIVKVARRTTAGTGQHKGDERIVAYRQEGDYFAGGLDLLGDRQAVTVTTINRCRVAEVPRHALLALFQRYPEVNQRFAARLREYVETDVATQEHSATTRQLPHFIPIVTIANRAVQNGLHSLVRDGVVEGTEVLVIDLDKCIHCDECEQACERRHGHSRMNRKGMVVGNISIATACRQCQDPVCMLCSRAGIARHPNGEVYITDSCIGCGICAERCPYGAISIIPVEEERAVSSWQSFSSFFNKGTGNPQASKTSPVASNVPTIANYVAPGPLDHARRPDGYDELRKKIAIKCDLCVGYNDQACVQACPTGAALRIQPTKFFGSAEEILRRRTN